VLFAFGGLVAVSVIIQLAWMAEAAPEDVRTEAFTWGGTANFIGLALGTVSAGWVVDNGGAANGFLLAGIPALLSVAVVALTRVDYAEADRAGALESVAEPVDTAAEAAPPVFPEPTVTWQTELELAEAAARWWEREATSLRERVADLQNALEAALLAAPSPSSQSESHARVQRMLERADAACLELRQRAEDDARRVRATATTASLEILAAVQRDAHALLARARRDADAIAAEAAGRQVGASTALPTQPTGRPLLLALPGLVEAGSADDDRADRDQDQATEAQ
jgi:hypothetical protein